MLSWTRAWKRCHHVFIQEKNRPTEPLKKGVSVSGPSTDSCQRKFAVLKVDVCKVPRASICKDRSDLSQNIQLNKSKLADR